MPFTLACCLVLIFNSSVLMFNFRIQADSHISPSQQLIDQIQFAIASGQYPPGHRLPSTRQLAQITNLHRNTISKVYRQLEKKGLVESITGSGIYVKSQGGEGTKKNKYLVGLESSQAEIIKRTIDQLLEQGNNLEQIKQLFFEEIEWRLRCSALILVTVPKVDIGAGQLMVLELEQALLVPTQLVPLEELNHILTQTTSATVVTSRYFVPQVLEIVSPESIRVIPIDIYDYKKELTIIRQLSKNTNLGIVSLSGGILRVAEILIHSLRGDEINTITATIHDQRKLNHLIRFTDVIMCDRNCSTLVKKNLQKLQSDLIRIPKIIATNNYISEKSIQLLKKELEISN